MAARLYCRVYLLSALNLADCMCVTNIRVKSLWVINKEHCSQLHPKLHRYVAETRKIVATTSPQCTLCVIRADLCETCGVKTMYQIDDTFNVNACLSDRFIDTRLREEEETYKKRTHT